MRVGKIRKIQRSLLLLLLLLLDLLMATLLMFIWQKMAMYRTIIVYTAGNCTDILPGCTTIWDVQLQPVYFQMFHGTLQPDELQAVCRCV